MATLRHARGALELPALDPPDELLYAYEACREMRALIASGEVAYTLDGVRRWLAGGASARECRAREQKLAAIRRLLAGGKLAEADERFAQAYRRHLESHPRRQAAALLARSALAQGAELEGLPEPAAAALRAS